MKKLLSSFLFAIALLSSCTFGNESSEGAVFGDYLYSIGIVISALIGVVNLAMWYYAKTVRNIKDNRKKILAFVGITIAIALFIFAKIS